MSLLHLDSVSYRYPSAAGPTIGPVSLDVPVGQILLLTGPTGCGKSTLLRMAAGLLQRHGRGEFAGEIRVADRNPATVTPSERVGLLGFVSQEPSDQIVASTTGDEIAFGLESAGWSREEIQDRVAEQLEAFDLPRDPGRPALALSGGQRQRLVAAAALAGGARLLLLDEPISQLDPSSALRFLGRLRAAADAGVTVVLVEHRIEVCLPFCDRVLLMDAGKVVLDSPARDLDLEPLRSLGLALPGLRELQEASGLALGSLAEKLRAKQGEDEDVVESPGGASLIETTGLSYRYPRSPEEALRGIHTRFGAGERVALLGGNGAGKSTLLAALAGDLGEDATLRSGAAVDVPQDPDLALFCPTVFDELAYGPREQGEADGPVGERVDGAAGLLSIGDLLDRPPQALSRGQRLRCAVAAALSCRPEILLLDEPTSGQDADQVEQMMRGIGQDLGPDRLLVFATHDVDLALRHATRILVLEEGRIVLDGAPATVLSKLDEGGDLVLPPLASWCRDEGLTYASARTLVQQLEEG